MSKTKRSILLMVITTIIIGFAQILYKKGAPALEMNLAAIASNFYVLLGFILYIISSILMTTSMKDNDLSTIYPLLSLSYIWVNLFASYFLQETIHIYKWIATVLIITGVTIIGYGTETQNK